ELDHQDQSSVVWGLRAVKKTFVGCNCFIFRGLVVSRLWFELSFKLALASWQRFLFHIARLQAQVRSFSCRVIKTLRGSSDDIGWLQRTPGMASVEDGSARFQELLE
ncbi:hypothetical protein M569_10683, partial [Genlisea aurea]